MFVVCSCLAFLCVVLECRIGKFPVQYLENVIRECDRLVLTGKYM